jgi:hypothetical protein
MLKIKTETLRIVNFLIVLFLLSFQIYYLVKNLRSFSTGFKYNESK